MRRLSPAQARRIALAAQGFGRGGPSTVGIRQVDATIRRMGALQIDSVNVLARSQYLPLFSRLGCYDTGLLTRAAQQPPRRVTESWAHQASFIPVGLHPLFRWRMAGHAQEAWTSVRRVADEHPDLVREVLAAVAGLGPVTPTRLTEALGHDPTLRREHWGWNWNVVKTAAEFLFFSGQILVAGRTPGFERIFDLPERVLPPDVLAAPTPTVRDAHRDLVALAARAHGVATVKCLADYWRLRSAATRAAVAELVDEGTLLPVTVDGTPAYLHAEAAVPRRVRARALLSPFDPLIWERARTQWLFGFHYRIGIYTPAAQRVHGYYVLPFLLDEALVARVDLKADRAAGRLLVQSAWREPDGPPHTAHELADELHAMAEWLSLGRVVVAPKGDLAAELAAQVTG